MPAAEEQEWVDATLRRMPAGTGSRATAADVGDETEYGEYEPPAHVPLHVLLKVVWVGPHETFERILHEMGVQVVYTIERDFSFMPAIGTACLC